jgi:hypothetical protein
MCCIYVGTGLSVVSHGSGYPHSPIVPPNFLYGALTCQPYQGIYVNHIYFQLANAFFLLSHLAPSGIHGVLYLRCTLLVGCAFLALWGWTIACWLDAALWNVLFVAINFVHVCTLLYKLRPIKFTREIEEVREDQVKGNDLRKYGLNTSNLEIKYYSSSLAKLESIYAKVLLFVIYYIYIYIYILEE